MADLSHIYGGPHPQVRWAVRDLPSPDRLVFYAVRLFELADRKQIGSEEDADALIRLILKEMVAEKIPSPMGGLAVTCAHLCLASGTSRFQAQAVASLVSADALLTEMRSAKSGGSEEWLCRDLKMRIRVKRVLPSSLFEKKGRVDSLLKLAGQCRAELVRRGFVG